MAELAAFVRTEPEHDLADHPAWSLVPDLTVAELTPEETQRYNIIGVPEIAAEDLDTWTVGELAEIVEMVRSIADVCDLEVVTEVLDSAPAFGDRRGYQMDPANVREALRECELDLAEGADVLMVKPALPNLDVIRAVRERFDAPLAAYNVSGEYAMLRAAAAKGWVDERQAALESLTAIRRAGADFVISYWTKELARWL